MSCNSCAKSFSLLRQEKGCPGCGFSYCSKCLNNKIFLEKLKSEVKVCIKCKNKQNSNEPSNKVVPPDAYFKRTCAIDEGASSSVAKNPVEQEIYDRLKKLKEDQINVPKASSNEEIIDRLQKLKGDIPAVSDTELQARLANIKGVPLSAVQSKPTLPVRDTRTEQEQANDLLKQYMQETKIDNNYKDEFDNLVTDIESRLRNLKGSTSKENSSDKLLKDSNDSEDEEETIKKILEKAKAETALEGNVVSEPVLNELPFCEICNEDATMRCLGCKYLFCKQCFTEHRDDDDGCNRYEAYTAPKNSIY